MVRVVAASSLTDAFKALEEPFEREHHVDLRLSFAGSQTLALQVRQGLAVDAVALADPELLQALHTEALVGQPVHFASNQLVVVAPAQAPVTFEQLPDVKRLVVGVEASPIGAYTLARFQREDPVWQQRVRARVVSKESNVRLVLAKVELGEADAAVVYASDAAGRALAVAPIPQAPAVELRVAPVTDAGQAFVRFIHANPAILAEHGLSP